MLPNRRTSPVVAIWFALAPAVLAEPMQYVDVVYDRPDGWTTMIKGFDGRDGYRSLSRGSDEKCDGCLMFLTASQSAPADLEALARRAVGTFLLPGDPAAKISSAPEASDFGRIKLAIGSWRLGDDLLFVAPVRLGDRATVIGFRGPADSPETIANSAATFQSALMTLIGGLHFSPPGPPAMPPPEPGPLDGVYWGSVTRTTLGMDGMLQMDIQGRTFVFWKEGWFHDGAPDNGLAPPTQAELIPGQGDGNWGTYRIDGKTIHITYTGGGTETLRLSASGGTIHDGDREMYPVDPLQDGERISGTISSSFYSGFNPVIATGGVAARSYTVFYPDGSYEDRGWSSVTANIKGSGIVDPPNIGGVAAHSTHETQRGRYEIKGGIIRYFPPDGSTGRTDLIYRVGDDSIFVGTQPLD